MSSYDFARRLVDDAFGRATGLTRVRQVQKAKKAREEHKDLYDVPDKKPYWELSSEEFEQIVKDKKEYPTEEKQ